MKMSQPQGTTFTASAQAQNSGVHGGLGIAAFVLGVVGLIGCWVPLLGILAAVVAVIGLAMGIAGIVSANNKNRKKGLAIAGTILSAVAIVIVIASQILYGSVVSTAIDEFEANPNLPSLME